MLIHLHPQHMTTNTTWGIWPTWRASRTPLHANTHPAAQIHTPHANTPAPPAHDHEHDLGHLAHVEGEAEDWHDFLVPVRHGDMVAGGTTDGGGGRTAAGDAFSEALLAGSTGPGGSKGHPYGSPRFESPRFRGA